MPLGSAFVFIHIIRTQGQRWSTTFPFVFDELDRFEFNSLYRITNHDKIKHKLDNQLFDQNFSATAQHR